MANPDGRRQPEQTERSGFFRWLPILAREERREILAHLQETASWNVDFVVMMGLSAALASLGLLNNATTVVIGAMLVAPLMSPLLGAGFALVQGNVVLFRDCLKAMGYGIAVSLLASLAMGLATPAHDPSPEIAARGNVNVLDLGIALVSGMAAAYAGVRPKLAATIVGVAIAAALLPPLAVVGIAAASAEWLLSGMAAVLFLTNLVAIVLGAAIVFKVMGVRARSTDESQTPVWARRMGMILVLATVVLVYPLGLRFESLFEAGHSQSAFLSIPSTARDAIVERINEEQTAVEFLSVRRDARDPESGVHVVLAAESSVNPQLVEDIEYEIQVVMGADTPVRVMLRLRLDSSGPAMRGRALINDNTRTRVRCHILGALSKGSERKHGSSEFDEGGHCSGRGVADDDTAGPGRRLQRSRTGDATASPGGGGESRQADRSVRDLPGRPNRELARGPGRRACLRLPGSDCL
jgi:uncharacterized hydrophobic protein (TIGR00271 family)